MRRRSARLPVVVMLVGSLAACSVAARDNAVSSGSSARSSSQASEAQPYAPNELLVKFKSDASREQIEAINRRFGASVKRVLDQGRLYHLSFSQSVNVRELVNAYEQLPEVEYAEPNYTVKTQ